MTGSTAATRGDSFKARRDANDTSTTAFGSSLVNAMASLEASDAEEPKGGRLHSFSVPRKKNNEIIDLNESSPSPTDDADALEWSTTSKTQNGPRYLQQTLASINARPRKPTSRPTLYRMPSNPASSSSGSYLPGSTSNSSSAGSSTSLFTKTASARISKTPVKMPAKKQPQQHESRTSAPAKANASTSRSLSSQSSSRNNALFGGEYPSIPSSGSAAPQRRAASSNSLNRRSSSDPIEDSTAATTTVRPRTAPPRLRKQEMEINDLLYSKRLDSSTPNNAGGSALGRDPAPIGLKRMSRATMDSYYESTPSAPQSARTTSRRLSTAASSAASVYSARPKTARAQWK